MSKLFILGLVLTLIGQDLKYESSSPLYSVEVSEVDNFQTVISYQKPIPARIKLLELINLSFFVDQSVVSRYRYILQVPKGIDPGGNASLTAWSQWQSESFAEMKVVTFSREGRYNFMIEYGQHNSPETKIINTYLDVKWDYPEVLDTDFQITNDGKNNDNPDEVLKNAAAEYSIQAQLWSARLKTACSKIKLGNQDPDILVADLAQLVEASAKELILENASKKIEAGMLIKQSDIHALIQKGKSDLIQIYRNTETNTAMTMAAAARAVSNVYTNEVSKRMTVAQADESSGVKELTKAIESSTVTITENTGARPKEKIITSEKIVTQILPDTAGNTESKSPTKGNNILPGNKMMSESETTLTDYDQKLKEAINDNNIAAVLSCIEKGADLEAVASEAGGKFFHAISGMTVNDDIISTAINKGIDINSTDKYGNTALQYSILTGNYEYASRLLSHGAEPGRPGLSGFNSLHLAVITGNTRLVRELILKGADKDFKTADGFTSLHIASRLDQRDAARELLLAGADRRIKSSQGLNSEAIARIQDFNDIKRLLRTKGKSSNYKSGNFAPAGLVSVNHYPLVAVDLKYDPVLLHKRRTNIVIQKLAIPILAASAAGAFYLRSEADRNYALYKNAENIDDARFFYDNTNRYDTYALISISVSAVSVYAFVHSAIKRNRINDKLKNTAMR